MKVLKRIIYYILLLPWIFFSYTWLGGMFMIFITLGIAAGIVYIPVHYGLGIDMSAPVVTEADKGKAQAIGILYFILTIPAIYPALMPIILIGEWMKKQPGKNYEKFWEEHRL